MKVKDSCPGQSASRSEGCTRSQGLQRRHGCEDKLSCFDIFGLQYQGPKAPAQWLAGSELSRKLKRLRAAPLLARRVPEMILR